MNLSNILLKNPYFQYLLLLYISLSKYKIANEIYNISIIQFSCNDRVEIAISKNLYNKDFKPKKILLLCHSVCGSLYEFSFLAKKLIIDGYGVISYSRKNHGKLEYDKFNVVGCPITLDKIVGYIKNKFESEINLIGFSAGTSLIATYLGNNNMKNNKYISKAILISPGFYFKHSTEKMSKTAKILCFINMYVFFLKHNYKKNNIKLIKSIGFHEFINNMREQYGYKNSDLYFKEHDPKYYLDKIDIPVLFVNSIDDFIFHGNIIIPLIKELPDKKNFIFRIHKTGGHISFFKDLSGNTYIYDHIIEFI